MKRLRLKNAFTLAETLITLTILGVVAAITVPSLINKYIESSNRTKVKKAMTTYEKALNQMIIDNDVKGAVGTVLNGSNCAITRPYFKTVEDGDTNCKFKTADRVWWDITDIEKPIIAFAEEDLNSTEAADMDSEKAFYMTGKIDDNGILRINDLAFEKKYNDDLVKIYKFLGNDVKESSNMEKYLRGDYSKPCEEANGSEAACTNCKSCYVGTSDRTVYGDDGKPLVYVQQCKSEDLTTCKWPILYTKYESPTNYEQLYCNNSGDWTMGGGTCPSSTLILSSGNEESLLYFDPVENKYTPNWQENCGGNPHCQRIFVNSSSGQVTITCNSGVKLKKVNGRYKCVPDWMVIN